MQTDIYYRDITRTDFLEAYLLDKIEKVVERFMQDDEDAHLVVRVETERHRTQNRKPVYTCEVILKPTHTRGLIKVKKTENEFNLCVSSISEALKKTLSRRSAKKTSTQKRSSYISPEERENFEFMEIVDRRSV